MSEIPSYLQPDFAPVARPEATVTTPCARFTVLTSRLLRLEYDPDDQFEDRASQRVWYREQPVPDFEVRRAPEMLEIITASLHLRYAEPGQPFSAANLSIELQESGDIWHYGDAAPANLGGTRRTLDMVDGATELEPGLLTRAGYGVLDDSQSLLFNRNGWLEPRSDSAGSVDVYFFGYGRDYRAWLAAYARIAGGVPLVPRWALGNWWSRYWAYSQEELLALMADFREREVPLSVCVVDMDWHITETGNLSPGWTGYTWNPKLFPEPEHFLDRLHALGLKVALNLHPAAGVYPHEAAYPEAARVVGIDPDSQQPVPFAIADPDFVHAYFRYLHHPLEAQGVDFWWIDWQQGTESALPGLDPLWWLNHLHFYDAARGDRRGFILSRWGGLGHHRYPIGFSGDTHVTWETLAFQPYFTATAANVLYGWWSHDIGGHTFGMEDAELYTRWVQFGVFSPILRLHSTNNPYHERRPWGYDAETLRIVREAMQLRHALIPYLYSAAWRNYAHHVPPLRPMYHDYPDLEAAYHCPDQYLFGTELLAAPYTTPADPDTRLSRQVVWLPPGDWFHFFDGARFAGADDEDGQWLALHGERDAVPVFARAGAIVPLAPRVGWGGVDTPETLDLFVFPGADGHFELYEDDGTTDAYLDGAYSLTPFRQRWEERDLHFEIGPVQGDGAQTPPQRAYTIHVRGVNQPDAVTLRRDGEEQPAMHDYDEETKTLRLGSLSVARDERLELVLRAASGHLLHQGDPRPDRLRRMLAAFHMHTAAKKGIADDLEAIVDDPGRLASFAVDLSPSQRRALLETLTAAGVHYSESTGQPRAILWNNTGWEAVSYRFSRVTLHEHVSEKRFGAESGIVPRFRSFQLDELADGLAWELSLFYGDLTVVSFDGDG